MGKLIVSGVALVSLSGVAFSAARAETPSATVPMTLDHNRMTVEVELRPASGSARRARAWVDTGGTSLVVAAPLARILGVDLSGMPAEGERTFETKAPAPGILLGGILLDTEGMKVSVNPGRLALAGIRADCVLPARCLRKLHVVFDYPARRLTVARPGVLKPRGAAVPCRVNPDTGLFLVEAAIDGEGVALGVDTGSAGTWVSDKLTGALLARHPDWRSAIGAAGSTNFFGFPFEAKGALLRLPAIAVGAGASIREVAVLGLDQRLFDGYSSKSAGQVAGFLGAEAISRYRLEVDLPGRMTWWEPGPRPGTRDLDILGLTLRPENDGSYTVAGVVSRDGMPVVPGVEPGDKLLRVGSVNATNAPMGRVIEAMRGEPGEARTLKLERAGKKITVRAAISRLP